LKCGRVVFSGHAIQRMFQRGVGRGAVNAVISGCETVAKYPDDSPYPSLLLLGFVEGKPLNEVVALDTRTDTCIIVTAYEPRHEQWEPGFRKRREE
jgi:hypothetical protein